MLREPPFFSPVEKGVEDERSVKIMFGGKRKNVGGIAP